MSTNKKEHVDLAKLKPGSSENDAKRVSGPADFGAHADDVIERNYTSQNTKQSDIGVQQPLSNEEVDGVRETGAGGVNSGPGSSSGGDLDVDFVGIAGNAGLAQDIETEHVDGPNDSTGSSDEFASGGHAQGHNQSGVGKVGGSKQVYGSAMLPPDDRTVGPHGADAISRQGDGNDDDAFVGEVSSSEASGRNAAGD